MSRYETPGVSTSKRSSVMLGVLAVIIVIVVALTWTVVMALQDDNRIVVLLRTESIGDGITVGTPVRFDGIEIGDVSGIESDGGAKQLILRLESAESAGLTDGLFVDYSPSNLFGISEIALKPGDGGAPLRDGSIVDLTGPRADRQRDATMGVLIRSVAQATGDILVPELTEILTRGATIARQFTPLMEAIVVSSRNIAETQTMPISQLLDQYGSMLVGTASMIDGTVGLINRLTTIEILNTDRELFDTTVNTVGREFFPGLAETLFAAQGHLSDYAAMLAPVLSTASRMVPTPGVSSTQLTELLSRLDRSFTSTPDGPILNIELVLDMVPPFTAFLPGLLPPTSNIGGGR
ncbi:MCE family protein [Nocardia puris]|uniref:MlaD family protein n=1 Tax=Nocardia puris TaxID=208602 RepID=UPI001895D8E4|nr:MlaD family protein [Nocardia puris]MBF6216321.1 MCE family protein [Nocardia puris]